MIDAAFTRNKFGHNARGFTLIEVAIVLVIVGLLLGGLLMPLAAQVKAQRIDETKKTMDEIKEALLGFALANSGHFPCPDTNDDGTADACAGGLRSAGNVPWAQLGVAAEDAWGNRFRYQVDNNFTAGTIDTATTAATNINTRNPTSKAQVSLVTNVPVVLLSYGPNGYGARTKNNTTMAAPPPQNTDEIANKGGAGGTFNSPVVNYWSRSATEAADAGACSDTAASPALFCEFDDIVTWIPTPILISRMVAANLL